MLVIVVVVVLAGTAAGRVHRFEAYGWHTQVVADGTNTSAIMEAIENAKKETGKPSIIKTKTIIGHGSQRQVRYRTAVACVYMHTRRRDGWGPTGLSHKCVHGPGGIHMLLIGKKVWAWVFFIYVQLYFGVRTTFFSFKQMLIFWARWIRWVLLA